MIPDDTKLVWVPDPRDGFVLGTVKAVNADKASVMNLKNGKIVTAPIERVFYAEDDQSKDYEDNCELMFLDEGNLLHNLQLRHKRDKIYTYVANILIAVNPYHDIPGLTTKEVMMKYKQKSLGLLPPHVFAIADKAYRDMRVYNQNQSINVSGESGSGKTESTKFIIRYLTETYGEGDSGDLERRIVEANPLLEAFGNAKTLKNLNSSRFGKYVEIHFNKGAKIVGAFISHYLLEKTRICNQSPRERNYHVFYRMCHGSIPGMEDGLKITDPSKFNYLNKSSFRDPDIDDVKGFAILDNAMDNVGITLAQKTDIYRIVSLVLHLGNIEFGGNANKGAHVLPHAKAVVNDVAKLMGLHGAEVQQTLTIRVMRTKKQRRGSVYKVPLSPDQAAAGRDAFAKSIYSRLFDYIVSCVNQCFPFKKSDKYIGVLDIAGFEIFEVNRFEQLCINYCNEKLQQVFNERILKEEQRLYKNEGLGLKEITFIDNEDCIELFERKITGVMDLLDDEMMYPSPSENHFTLEVYQQNGSHPRIAPPRKSPNPMDRQVKDDEGFLIRHFAGAVCYQTEGFLSRNNDALQDNLKELLLKCEDTFLKSLFPSSSEAEASKGKMGFESIGKKFRDQLKLLMEKLSDTGANFVRCIKPNEEMKKHLFDGGQILRQLQCAGMVSVLHLMQEGYPSRTPFASLYNKYKSLLPPKLVPNNPRVFCKTLLYALGMHKDDFAFGITKVFFRPGKFAMFDQLLLADPEFLKQLVEKVVKWIARYRFRRVIWCAVSVQKCARKIKFRAFMLVKIQKTVRMFLAVCKHKPRYETVENLKNLDYYIEGLSELVTELRKKHEIYQDKVDQVAPFRDEAIQTIKMTVMNKNELMELYEEVTDIIENLADEIQTEVAAQEEEERRAAMRRYKWRQAIWCAVSVQKLANKIKFRAEMLVRIQKTVRMFITARQYRPRIEGLSKLKILAAETAELAGIVATLKKKSEIYYVKTEKVKLLTNKAIRTIKNSIMHKNDIISLHADLADKIETLVHEVTAEKAAQEEEERKARMIRQRRWRKAIHSVIFVYNCSTTIQHRREELIRIQKTVRMFIAVRKHKHRYEGLIKLKTLDKQIEEFIMHMTTLRKKREYYESQLNEIQPLKAQAQKRIRNNTEMDESEIELLYTNLMVRIDSLLKDLRLESAAQLEQERLEKMEHLARLQLSFLKVGNVGDLSKKFEAPTNASVDQSVGQNVFISTKIKGPKCSADMESSEMKYKKEKKKKIDKDRRRTLFF